MSGRMEQMKRVERLVLAASLVLITPVLVWELASPDWMTWMGSVPKVARYAIVLACTASTLGIGSWRRSRSKALVAQARSAGWRLCPHCTYDLSSTSQGPCPECGRAWTPDQLDAIWQKHAGHWS